MEMLINLVGFGVALPKTGFGVNLLSSSYIAFRYSKYNPDILLGISDLVSLGSKSGTFIASWIKTDWFTVCPKKHNWVNNTNALIGKKAELEVLGTVILFGTVDVKFTTYDKNGNKDNELISKVDIKSAGGQLSNTKVRGVLCEIK